MKRILTLSILALCGYSTVSIASDPTSERVPKSSLGLGGTSSELETKTRVAEATVSASQGDIKGDTAYFNALAATFAEPHTSHSAVPKPEASKMLISKELAEQVLATNPELHDVIKKLQLMVPGAPTKILLFGPGGTGKTTLVQVVADALKRPCIMHDGASIGNEYQNSGCMNLERIFAAAKKENKPCVISIDELQLLVNKHNNTKLDDSSMLTKLWKLLDQYIDEQMIFIGTSNYVADMPENLIERFDECIEVTEPDAKQRASIIEFHGTRLKLKAGKDFWADLARETGGFTGRNLENLMKKIASAAHIKTETTVKVLDCLPIIKKMKLIPAIMKKKAPKKSDEESLELQRESVRLQHVNLKTQVEALKHQAGMAQNAQLIAIVGLLNSSGD